MGSSADAGAIGLEDPFDMPGFINGGVAAATESTATGLSNSSSASMDTSPVIGCINCEDWTRVEHVTADPVRLHSTSKASGSATGVMEAMDASSKPNFVVEL
jgi:hypothetical protein